MERLKLPHQHKTKNDDVNQELADIYQRILGEEHPNWEEFQQAMINDGRLVLRFVPQHAVGMLN